MPDEDIGLIGGMSWESSAGYYRLVNEETRRHLGGMHSARIVSYSFDFADIEELQQVLLSAAPISLTMTGASAKSISA